MDEIIYQENLVSTVCTFNTPRYCICMKENIVILKSRFDSSTELMNHRSEIYGKCKHSPECHSFAVSTDESHKDEKVDESSWLSNHNSNAFNIKCRNT